MTRRPKKLLIDCRMLNSSGIGNNLKNILPELEQEFHLVLAGRTSELNSLTLFNPFDIIEFNKPIFSVAEQIFFFRYFVGADLIWFPHWNVPWFRYFKAPTVVTICDVFHLENYSLGHPLKRLIAFFYLKRALRIANHVLTISNFSRSRIQYHLGYEKTHVIRCGSTDRSKKPEKNLVSQNGLKSRYNLPEAYILFIGNVKPHKNLLNLCRALQHNMNINLVIAGKINGFRTSNRELFDFLEENQELKRRIYFTGEFNEEDKVDLICNATALVMPSFYEGFGLPPLEAQTLGVPVLLSQIPVFKELYSDSAIYFDPSSPSDIAAQIELMLTRLDIRKDFIERGFLNSQRFSWNTAGMKHLQLFREIP